MRRTLKFLAAIDQGLMQRIAAMIVFVVTGLAPKALACSSCGSGGADPVILNPAESTKFYLGLTHQNGFQDIDLHGNRQKSYGPKIKQSADFAVAQRLTSKVFASAVVAFGRNVYNAENNSQIGDITLNSRATLLTQNIAEPLVPQFQLLLSHRFAVGRSVYNQKLDHFLDVFGAGYDETYGGFDVWFGMSSIMAGGSMLFGFPQSASTDNGTLQVGPMQRLIATIGFMPAIDIKVISGFIHEQRGGSHLDGIPQAESDKLDHSLFLTAETLYTESSNFRLTLSRKAAFGSNKNAVAANVFTVAWMLSL